MKFDIRIFENLIFEYSFFSKSLNEYIQYSYSVQIDSTNIFDIRIRPKLARRIYSYSYSVQNFIFVLHCLVTDLFLTYLAMAALRLRKCPPTTYNFLTFQIYFESLETVWNN